MLGARYRIHLTLCGIAVGVFLGNAAGLAAPSKGNSVTGLFSAISAGDTTKVKDLLGQGVNANTRNKDHLTALMFALEYHCPDQALLPMMRLLIAHGADVNAKDDDQSVTLEFAIGRRSVPAVQLLLAHGAKVNVIEGNHIFPLQTAVSLGNLPLVQTLLKAGAKLRLTKTGSPLLMKAVEFGGIQISKLLLAHGANVNELDDQGKTALMTAAGEGRADEVTLLLNKGAKVNIKSQRGETALTQAAQSGALEIAQTLLAHGANVNDGGDSHDGPFYPPLINAISSSIRSRDTRLAKLLLDHGANPNAISDGTPAITWAARAGEDDIVNLLLAKGVQVKDLTGQNSPLLAVLQIGENYNALTELYGFGGVTSQAEKIKIRQEADENDTAIVAALLDHGIDLTHGENKLALLEAAGEGITPIVQLLLDHDADINLDDRELTTPEGKMMLEEAKRNPQAAAEILSRAREAGFLPLGMTPLLAVAKAGNPGTVKLLLEKGANPTAVDAEKRTALMEVAAYGRMQTARYLPTIRESILQRANMGAVKPIDTKVGPAEKAEMAKWADQGDLSILRDLVDKKVDVNAQDAAGNTALMDAAEFSSPAVVEFLIHSGAKVDLKDRQGRTALMLVVESGRIAQAPEQISQDLQMRMDSASLSTAVTPKEKADLLKLQTEYSEQKAELTKDATATDVAIIKLLIAGGADRKAVDNKGRSALSIATKAHHDLIAALLHP